MAEASISSSTPVLPNYTAISRRGKPSKTECSKLSKKGYVCTLVTSHPVWCPHMAGSLAGIVEIWFDEPAMTKMDKQLGKKV